MPTGIYQRSDLHSKKISDALKGRVFSKEWRRKIRDSNIGKKRSIETRERISKSMKGIVHSDEAKRKISESLKGIKFPRDRCIRISNGLIGMKRSEESKKKQSESMIGDKNFRWKEDRTSLKKSDRYKNDVIAKEWAINVKKRDGWVCKLKNAYCNGRLEAHHILPWRNYPEVRYDINNGICLCVYHHPKKRLEETSMVPILQELIKII